jgi:diaminohydroxyphosphoribosylaminopyrimidine deaminase / 5-amino-6-(5-phosphoribosylamino)uracil reductase
MTEQSELSWLTEAVELSRLCQPSSTAFSVGAIVVDAYGVEVARGYSREGGQRHHAEEIALRKAVDLGADVVGGTVYSTLEPCGERRSGAVPCAELIRQRGLRRVVFVLPEPALFVVPHGVRTLTSHGIAVSTVDSLAGAVRAVNAHLFEGMY